MHSVVAVISGTTQPSVEWIVVGWLVSVVGLTIAVLVVRRGAAGPRGARSPRRLAILGLVLGWLIGLGASVAFTEGNVATSNFMVATVSGVIFALTLPFTAQGL